MIIALTTSWFAHKRSLSQDEHALKTELRGILQRLFAIRFEASELMTKNAGNPEAVRQLGPWLSQETSLLAGQAAQILRQLPNRSVTANEYLAVSEAFTFSSNQPLARTMLQKGLSIATEMIDEVAARRTSARNLIIDGYSIEGRQEFEKALQIFSKYTGFNEATKIFTNLETHLYWADAEALVNAQDMAMEHLNKAEQLSYQLPAAGGQNIRNNIAQKRKAFGSPTSYTMRREPFPTELGNRAPPMARIDPLDLASTGAASRSQSPS